MYRAVFVLHILQKGLLLVGSIRRLVFSIDIHSSVPLPKRPQLPEGINDVCRNEEKPVVGVTSVYYLDNFCPVHFIAKNKSSFHCVFFLAKAHIMPSMWSNMSLYSVMTWWRVTLCRFVEQRIQNRNCCKISVALLTAVHSSWAAKRGRMLIYFGLLGHSRVNSRNRKACLSNSSVAFQPVFTSRMGSIAIRTFAFS